MHKYELTVGAQVPPFWQGLDAHGLALSHKKPVNAEVHSQAATLLPLSTQLPPFWQGFGLQILTKNEKIYF